MIPSLLPTRNLQNHHADIVMSRYARGDDISFAEVHGRKQPVIASAKSWAFDRTAQDGELMTEQKVLSESPALGEEPPDDVHERTE